MPDSQKINQITVVVFLNNYKQPLTINETFLQINNLPYESVLETSVANILDFLLSNWQTKWGTPKPSSIAQIRTTSRGKAIRTALKLSDLYKPDTTVSTTSNEEYPQIVLHCSLRPMSSKDVNNNYRASLLVPNSNHINNNNNTTPIIESLPQFENNDGAEIDYSANMKSDSPLYFANDSNRLSTYHAGTRSSYISLNNHNGNNTASSFNYNPSLSRSPRNDTMSAYTKSLTQRGLFSSSGNNMGTASPLDFDSDDDVDFVKGNHNNFSDSVSEDTYTTAAIGNNNDDSSEMNFTQIIVTDRARREQEEKQRKRQQELKKEQMNFKANNDKNANNVNNNNNNNIDGKKSDSTNDDTIVEKNVRDNNNGAKYTTAVAPAPTSSDYSKCCVIV